MRVTNLLGVDLNTYSFDHDLTFAALVMHPDGTVLHRFGSRHGKDAEARISERALIRLLEGALESHAAYAKAPSPPPAAPPRRLEEIPPFARKLAKRKQDCLHCHFVFDAERAWAQEQKTWTPDSVWRFPPPTNVGLTLERDDPSVVDSVGKGGPAGDAGLEPGDRLVRLEGRRILSEADVQWVLERAPFGATPLAFEANRKGEAVKGKLALADGWKRGTALDLAWRPSMWALRPNPGFGGRDLTPDEKAKLGLARDAFAFRIDYLIDWGDHPEDGRNAIKAGLAKGDVVTSVAGKSDFASHQHFQSWFRLERKKGEKVEVKVLRGGAARAIMLPVIE